LNDAEVVSALKREINKALYTGLEKDCADNFAHAYIMGTAMPFVLIILGISYTAWVGIVGDGTDSQKLDGI